MKHEPLHYAHDEGHTDVCYSQDGTKFITCGSDGDIRIWSTDETEDPVHNCVGEWALCVRQSNNNLYVASGSNDIQILTYPEGERNGVLDRFVAPINHIAINDDYIALAGEDMEVKLVKNGETTVFDGLKGPCLSVALCPKSRFLAASSGDGKLRIWTISDRYLVKEIECFPKANSFANAKQLCRVDFDPKAGALLAYPRKNDVVVMETLDWSEKFKLSYNEIKDWSIAQFSPCGNYIIAASISGDFVIWERNSNFYAFSKHCKSIPICGLAWNPLNNGELVYTDTEGQLGIIRNAIKAQETEAEVDYEIPFEEPEDDDENVISLEKIKRQYEEEIDETDDEIMSLRATPRPKTPEIPLQAPFMPSSTPEHLSPRYLCWNSVGIVRCYGNNEDNSNRSIEVEFHDATFHSSVMLNNYNNYTMGSLSKTALVVANAKQFNVIPLNNNAKEWSLKIDDFEDISHVSVAEKFIFLATNQYRIRFFSVFGTQLGLFALPGQIVSINSFKTDLLVAYHLSSPRKDDQLIHFKLVKFKGFSFKCQDLSSGLSPSSQLAWLGFSDCGTPALMDNTGILRLFPAKCNVWVPFFDFTKHSKSPSDGFFVITIFESCQTIGGLKCKGSLYPGFIPTPTMCELPLESPFCDFSTDKTQMEMNLFAWSNLKVENTEKKFKETGLKVFALACKNNLDQRAMEFMEIIENPQLLTLGIKYASKLDKRRLAEKLMELAAKLTDNENIPLSNTSSTSTPNTIMRPKLILSNPSKYLSKTPKPMKETAKDEIAETELGIQQPEVPEINTQESLFSSYSYDEEPIPVLNPFLKKSKSENSSPNPLNLTDKYAGIEYEGPVKKSDSEKRKQPESGSEKPKGKQRKLDKFTFQPRS